MNARRKAAASTATAAAAVVIGAALIAALYGFGAAALAVLLTVTVAGLLAVAEHHADTAEQAEQEACWAAAMADALTQNTDRAYAAGFRDGAR